KSYVLQDADGLVAEAHSISAGLDYPGVGPEHAWLKDSGRARYVSVTDDEALAAFDLLAKSEGIICALESAHAIAHLPALARTLGGGMRLKSTLDLLREFRKVSAVPVVLFGYFNPIFSYGCAKLTADARAAGAEGLLVVDLPLDEADELRVPARAAGLDWVPLLAPTSTPARIARAAEVADGFVYYVS